MSEETVIILEAASKAIAPTESVAAPSSSAETSLPTIISDIAKGYEIQKQMDEIIAAEKEVKKKKKKKKRTNTKNSTHKTPVLIESDKSSSSKEELEEISPERSSKRSKRRKIEHAHPTKTTSTHTPVKKLKASQPSREQNLSAKQTN